jgi:hypothetical protein
MPGGKIVALDDTVQYRLSVSGNSPAGRPSTLPKFEKLSVVGTFQSSNITMINGQASVAKSFVYTLQPGKVGQAYIGRASITINGQTYTTEPISITVTKAEGRKNQTGPQSGARSGFPSIWDDFDEFFKSPFTSHSPRPQTVKDPIKVDLKASQYTVYVITII